MTVNWKRIAASVAIALAIGLALPNLSLLRADTIVLIAAAAAVGLLARLSVLDACLYVAALLFCLSWIEPVAAPELLACLSLGLLAATGRPRFALLAGSSIVALLLFSIEMKRRFGGSILTWQDVRYFFLQFTGNAGVFASQPTLAAYASVALLIVFAACAFAWKLEGHGAGASRRQYVARALAFVLALWCATELNEASLALSPADSWTLSEKTIAKPISAFLSTVHLEPKVQYNKVDTRQFALAVQAARATVAPVRKADVVVFLQESQINTAAFAFCPRSLCAFDVFGAPQGTVDHGELRVHTYGAGTWLSEFALATGLPHRLYGPAGEFAPFNVAPGVHRSFIRSLKAAGYHTVAVYPTKGGMMNGRMAYGFYGFDEFFDSDDLGLPGGFATTDSKVHEAAIKVLEAARRQGKPVFVMALTVFNHGEHGINMARVPADVRDAAHSVLSSPGDADSLADYVWRTREFEATYGKTREAVLGSGRPAVLAWFGDHQPSFASAPELRKSLRASAAASGLPESFVTWYNISTNTPGAVADPGARRLDIAFLGGLLAQRAGVPLDDWLAANVVARERCGGLLFECADARWRDGYLSYLLGDLQSIH